MAVKMTERERERGALLLKSVAIGRFEEFQSVVQCQYCVARHVGHKRNN